MSMPASNKSDLEDKDVVDRRGGLDRRDFCEEDDGRSLNRRRGPGRRLSDFVRLAEEGEMSREQIMFLHAIDAFKQANHVSFPVGRTSLRLCAGSVTARPCPAN